jgi:farnesyl-diphosphate farnesyltransferase
LLLPGVVKMRRGLTARVFDECEDLQHLYTWFIMFLQQLQEKALLQVRCLIAGIALLVMAHVTAWSGVLGQQPRMFSL